MQPTITIEELDPDHGAWQELVLVIDIVKDLT